LPQRQTKAFKIPGDTRYLIEVRNFVRSVIDESSFPLDDANRIVLAVDEAVANVMEHAYEKQGDTNLEVDIIISASANEFNITIKDIGKDFSPDSVMEVDIKEHVKAGKRNGLGLFLIRKIMDEVSYRFDPDEGNMLTMVKYAKNTEG